MQTKMHETVQRPSWIRVKAPLGDGFEAIKEIISKQRLNTVCYSAACPNMGECWNNGTATFMILGNECTRACRFCNVATSKRPAPVDLDEPKRLVESIIAMNLKHVVITSVARDDLEDGGALQFARILKLIKEKELAVSTEVLVPDFFGSVENLSKVIDEKPTIFNHNIETIERLTPKIRSGAKYARSLKLLMDAKKLDETIITKSGIMLGLGETDDEVKAAITDLRQHRCDHLTIGQYLRPTSWHHEVVRYASLKTFEELKNYAQDLGFSHVVSGPLVRSSYHAEKGVKKT